MRGINLSFRIFQIELDGTQIGTPYYSYPVPNSPNLQTLDFLAARDDIFGRGGANDAPTSEESWKQLFSLGMF